MHYSDDIRNLSGILSALLDSTWQKFEIVSDTKIEIVSPHGVVEHLIPTENGMLYRSIFQHDEFLASGEIDILSYIGVLSHAYNRRKGN